jgi:copper chaperone CopZ
MFFMSNVIHATEIAYQGKVNGMVCAFCSYNVGKKIASVPGVIDASVNVNLKSGEFSILSTMAVKETQITEIFLNSGFQLLSFSEVNPLLIEPLTFSDKAKIQLSFTISDLSLFGNVLDEMGNIAIKTSSKIEILAPISSEIEILKPLIAGKQREIKLKFIDAQSERVKIKLFQKTKKL